MDEGMEGEEVTLDELKLYDDFEEVFILDFRDK